jgi:hypothetical protein
MHFWRVRPHGTGIGLVRRQYNVFFVLKMPSCPPLRVIPDLAHRVNSEFRLQWSSHGRKGAARRLIDMVWLYRSLIPVGRRGIVYLFRMISSYLQGVSEGGESAPCGLPQHRIIRG